MLFIESTASLVFKIFLRTFVSKSCLGPCSFQALILATPHGGSRRSARSSILPASGDAETDIAMDPGSENLLTAVPWLMQALNNMSLDASAKAAAKTSGEAKGDNTKMPQS